MIIYIRLVWGDPTPLLDCLVQFGDSILFNAMALCLTGKCSQVLLARWRGKVNDVSTQNKRQFLEHKQNLNCTWDQIVLETDVCVKLNLYGADCLVAPTGHTLSISFPSNPGPLLLPLTPEDACHCTVYIASSHITITSNPPGYHLLIWKANLDQKKRYISHSTDWR